MFNDLSLSTIPAPLTCLYFYLEQTTPSFLAENLKNFKDSGYGVLMIELNSDLSIELFLKMSDYRAKNLPQDPMTETNNALATLIQTAQKHKFEIQFIDPQSFHEAGVSEQNRLNNLCHKKLSDKEIEAEEQRLNARSTSMARTVIEKYHAEAAKQQKGGESGRGIITLMGFANHLMPEIVKKEIPCAMAMILRDKDETYRKLPFSSVPDRSIWHQISLESNMSVYSTPITLLDISEYKDEGAYDRLESELGLLAEAPLPEKKYPSCAKALAKRFPDMQFSINKRMIISATLPVAVHRQNLIQNLPLKPSIKKESDGAALRFSGINLHENGRHIYAWENKKR